ncbi:MAG: DeoR/GlpR family DNA-binding transcription regulator [Synergistaceae bacterium]|nr:DeoR/GlpR family DNA-binding transcription regulator [Synergistaceae bacterium]
MLRPQRIDAIENYLIQHRVVNLDELCKVFSVSKNTIRRDIDEIHKRGCIRKIYGGVRVVEKDELMPFTERNKRALDAKKRVAKCAAEFVEDGDIIFVDSGTTTCHMVDHLKDKTDLTVITNNLDFIVSALPHENINIISLSGALNRKTLSFTGASAANSLESFNISKAFMASTGITVEKGATNYFADEYDVKQAAIRRSQKRFLLVDHSKQGVISLRTFADLSDFDCLVTEAPLPETFRNYLERNACKVVLVKGDMG